MRAIFIIVLASLLALTMGCGEAPKTNQSNTNTNSNAKAGTPSTPEPPPLTVVERPQKIKDLMSARGEQDSAAPALKIVSPRANEALASSTVKVKLELSGDLKGYLPGMDETTHTGNHIHIILDNQAYEAYYDLGQPFELRNVMDGDHVLRVFPSRPWHESYKTPGGFQMVKFRVRNGGSDPSKPTTTANGQTMANTGAAPTPEGKDMKPSNSGPVDPRKPLLTYSRPKGEYKGADADAIMIDFWLTGAMLTGDGGELRVRYSVDDGEAKYIDKWAPIWLTGWPAGKHNVKLELVDKDGNLVDNAGYNATTREITVVK